jgi:hypothetical protein
MTGLIAAILLAGGDKDVPWQILLPGAFIIPIAVLLCFSFFVRRRGGGH